MTGVVTFDEVAAAAEGLADDGKAASFEAVREVLGGGAAAAIHQHLRTWKAGRTPPAPVPEAEVPPALLAALGDWAKQYAQEAGIGAREALAQTESEMAPLLATIEQLEGEREDLQENITRLNAELRNARLIATDALVGKAKDQLAIDGKESQLADLRAQLERSVASSSAQSDARLKAEMELIGAVTARDNFAAEVQDLRAQLEARYALRKP